MTRSFVDQTLSYFGRPQAGMPGGPVGGPAAWRGADLDAATWTVHLDDDQIAELDAALNHARAAGVMTDRLTTHDFPLPTLADTVKRWADEVASGRGFLLVKGLPVAEWGDEGTGIVCWGLGLHLGEPGEQNPQGDLLGHVVDEGEDPDDLLVRLYRTTGAIRFHCDAADAVGLLCLRNAATGGDSRLASSVFVHDEMWRTAPELARRMYEPFEFDTRGDAGGLRHFPLTPFCFDGRRVRICFHGDYYRTVARHDDVGPLEPDQLAALDLFEEIANRPDVRLDMRFEPGDLQLVSNHTVVHARTAYDDEHQPRHLLRLWLTLEGA